MVGLRPPGDPRVGPKGPKLIIEKYRKNNEKIKGNWGKNEEKNTNKLKKLKKNCVGPPFGASPAIFFIFFNFFAFVPQLFLNFPLFFLYFYIIFYSSSSSTKNHGIFEEPARSRTPELAKIMGFSKNPPGAAPQNSKNKKKRSAFGLQGTPGLAPRVPN